MTTPTVSTERPAKVATRLAPPRRLRVVADSRPNVSTADAEFARRYREALLTAEVTARLRNL